MLTPEREKEIRLCAEQFHHNSTAIEDVDAELAIRELLAEIDRLKAEVHQVNLDKASRYRRALSRIRGEE